MAKDARHTPGRSSAIACGTAPGSATSTNSWASIFVRVCPCPCHMLDSLMEPGVIRRRKMAAAFGARVLCHRYLHRQQGHFPDASGARNCFWIAIATSPYGVVLSGRTRSTWTRGQSQYGLRLSRRHYSGNRGARRRAGWCSPRHFTTLPLTCNRSSGRSCQGIKVIDARPVTDSRFHAFRPTALKRGGLTTQSTHKILSAFSQAACYERSGFNEHLPENFNMHLTSPQ